MEATGKYTAAERAAILASCMLGFALDFYDILIMPFVMPSVQKGLGISLAEVGSVTSFTLVGSVIGGGLFGWLGDKLGRKQSLQLTLLMFSLGSVASAFAWDYYSLVTLRFITGIGLGGEWGAGMVLFNEVWNKERRGIGSAFIQGSAVLAASAAAIVGVWATTTFSLEWGWRIALLTGGSPILLMFFVRFFMPESRAWEQFDQLRKGGLVEAASAGSNPLLQMFQGQLLPITVKAVLLLTAYMFCYYSIAVFIPTLFQKSLSVPPEVVRNMTLITSVMSGLSYLTMGLMNDAFGRRSGALIPCMFWIVMAVGLYKFGHVPYTGELLSFPGFWIYAAFMTGHSSLAVAGPWLSELFPLQVRATAVSFIYMAARGAGSFAPVAVPLAAGYFGNDLASGMLLAVPAIAVFLVMALLLPETRRRDLAFQGAGQAGRVESKS